MSKTFRTLGIIVLVILVLALVVGAVWRWFTRQAFPKTSGAVSVAGISQPVEILRDEFGVAHIYAHTTADLFFGQGYVHAQERFWQMEFQRRVAKGRMAELVGEAGLDTDKYLRHFGIAQSAQAVYERLDPEAKLVVDAYSAGVNAYIKDRPPAKLGLEFAILGLQGTDIVIEEWSPTDSLAWGYMMIFDQSDQLSTELSNIQLLAYVGQEKFDEMRPSYRADRPVIIPPGEMLESSRSPSAALSYLGDQELAYLTNLRPSHDEFRSRVMGAIDSGLSGGSNSFAVSGSKTTSGMPLLANDPHMGINMPAIWYEISLHCIEKSADCKYNFGGFSLAGVPGVLIGFNDRLAWGLTNASFDAEDVFIERINPENPNQYEVNGEWVDMEIRREEIKVLGKDKPEVIFVRKTRNGVVATDYMVDQLPYAYSDDELNLYALSYAWTALEPVFSVPAVLGVNGAQNWDEFVDALSEFDAGKQNWLYADVEGNIGYVLPGKIPIRAGGDGTLPVPGWNDDYIWTGFIPYDELPKTFNPAQGFIATANNPQVRAEDYPYLLSAYHDYGQRAWRITNTLQNDSDGVTIDDMIAIQTDNQSISALEVIPYLDSLVFDEPQVEIARDALLGWDAQMTMDSPQSALYNIFWVQLLADTFHDQLPPDLYPVGSTMEEDVMYFLLQEPDNDWWDDVATSEVVEDRDAILKTAFEKAYADGVETFGDNFSDWRWGDLHTITFRNAVLGNAGISFIEDIFNRGPFPTNGSMNTIQKTCWSAKHPYKVGCIPALRQVIDLGDLSNSRMIHSVGQSGHPFHRFYDHFIDAWRTFQYHPSNWARQDVEAGEHDLLTLEPAP